LYSPEEAGLVQHLNMPMDFTSTEQLAAITGKDINDTAAVLDRLHKKNALIGMGNLYCLPPIPMLINVHQFYSDTKPDDIEAARLQREFFINYRYYRYYETSEKGTPVFRAIPVEEAINEDQQVLSSEEAHEFIMSLKTEDLALVPCPCRTRMEKLGIRKCKDKYPIGSCIMLGMSALHFESLGLGKRVTKEQAIAYFDEMNKLGLVGQTDNAKSGNSVICLCCECCCSQIRGRTRWDNPDAIEPSNFVPHASEDCIMCGTCLDRCFFGALSIDETTERTVADPEKCIGCGVCTLACEQAALKLYRVNRAHIFEKTGAMLKTIDQENYKL
jgi:ferredoxin